MLVRHMSKILPGDKNTFLHTYPYSINSPPEKIDPGEKNSVSHPLRYYLRPGAIHVARTPTYPGNDTDRHHFTPGDERQWILYSHCVYASIEQ